MKVRTYLALTATAVLIPVVIFSAAALDMLLDAEREAALRGVHETARATALIVDRELTGAEATLRTLGTSAHLANMDLSSFYQQAKSATANRNSWIVLFDRSGQQLVNTSVAFGTRLPRRERPERGIDIMQSGNLYISDLIMGPVARRPVISVEAPIATANGQRYVISQAFPAEHFRLAFEQSRLPPDWVIGIFGRDGITIARSRGEKEFIGKPTVPALLAAARRSNEGMLRTRSLDGVDIYGVYTHSPMSGWLVVIGVPAADIEASARNAVFVAGIGLLAAIACAVAAAFFLGRRLARSIAGVAQSAAALGREEQPPAGDTRVAEVDKLHAALAEAGQILKQERDSRAAAEAERATLFASEQEARRQAELQNQAKDEFLAMLGHELRNPLGAIANAVAIMECEGIEPEIGKRAQAVISRQSAHLGRIVDDLLDVSRLMSGKVFLNRQAMDLAEAVRHCISALTDTHRIGQHSVHVDTQPAWIDADQTRVEQIISNLLINAVKYTPGAGRIDVDVRAIDGKATLVVRDNGIGIPEHLLRNIFGVFVQAPAELDRAHGGLGIGLALVQRLVALHGGTVTAQSEGAGKGSTFTVRLPLAAAPSNADSSSVLRQAGDEACHVLLIEDNADNRQTLAAVLGIYGHRVTEAADGNEGLRLAASVRPDIALIDIGLPGMSGYDVARRLRAEPATSAIRLIAITGYGQAEDRQRALDAGFDAHLAKPVDPARLLDTINHLRP